MDWKGIGMAAVAMEVVGFVEHMVESLLTMGYYTDPAYSAIWSKAMMPVAGPPPAQFYALSIVFGLLTWGLFAYGYGALGGALKVKDEVKRGMKFGAIIFLVAGVPGTLMMYLLLNIPSVLLAEWAFSGLLLYLIGGVVAAKLVKAE